MKDELKELKNCIGQQAKVRGFGHKKGMIYRRVGDNFVFCNYIMQKAEFIYRVEVKDYCYDTILWDVMGEFKGRKFADSFRVEGAFTAPSLLVAKGCISFTLSDDVNAAAASILDELEMQMKSAYAMDCDAYVLNRWNEFSGTPLLPLALVHSGNFEEAAKLCLNHTSDFYSRLALYLEIKMG